MKKSFVLAAALFAGVMVKAQDTNVASHIVNVTIPEIAILDLEGPGTTGTGAQETPTAIEMT